MLLYVTDFIMLISNSLSKRSPSSGRYPSLTLTGVVPVLLLYLRQDECHFVLGPVFGGCSRARLLLREHRPRFIMIKVYITFICWRSIYDLFQHFYDLTSYFSLPLLHSPIPMSTANCGSSRICHNPSRCL